MGLPTPQQEPRTPTISPLILFGVFGVAFVCVMACAVVMALLLSPNIAQTRAIIAKANALTQTPTRSLTATIAAAATLTPTLRLTATATLTRAAPGAPAATGQPTSPPSASPRPPSPTPPLPNPLNSPLGTPSPAPSPAPTRPPATNAPASTATLPPTFTPAPAATATHMPSPTLAPSATATTTPTETPGTPTATSTATPTATPISAQGSTVVTGTIKISEVRRNAAEPNAEFIEVQNTGNDSVSIGGWKLVSPTPDAVYTFANGIVLNPNETCRIFSGPAAGTSGGTSPACANLVLNRTSSILPERGQVQLKNNHDALMAVFNYGG